MIAGTGASCIYALLGAKLFGWSFIATDSDPRSLEVKIAEIFRNFSQFVSFHHQNFCNFFQVAKQNVESNGLRDKIEIAHVDKNRLIKVYFLLTLSVNILKNGMRKIMILK